MRRGDLSGSYETTQNLGFKQRQCGFTGFWLSQSCEQSALNQETSDRPVAYPTGSSGDPADLLAGTTFGQANEIAMLCAPAKRRAQRIERTFIE